MAEPPASSPAIYQLLVVLRSVSRWCGGNCSWPAIAASPNSMQSFSMPSIGAPIYTQDFVEYYVSYENRHYRTPAGDYRQVTFASKGFGPICPSGKPALLEIPPAVFAVLVEGSQSPNLAFLREN